jgi:Family of unknown function (DUF6166)
MSDDDAVYVGMKAPKPEHGHGGPLVVGVQSGAERRTLQPRPGAPTEGPPYEWGYHGRGPTELAAAILFDALGFDAPAAVALCFMSEVVAELPKGDFELPRSTVRRWIADRVGEACDARLEP